MYFSELLPFAPAAVIRFLQPSITYSAQHDGRAFVPALCDSPYVAEKLRSGSVDFAVPPLELFRMPEEGTVVLPCAPEWKATCAIQAPILHLA